MAKAALSKRRMATRQAAIQTLEKHGDDPEVCRQVEALVGSLDDTLSDEIILEELKGAGEVGEALPESVRGRALRTRIGRACRFSLAEERPRKSRFPAGYKTPSKPQSGKAHQMRSS